MARMIAARRQKETPDRPLPGRAQLAARDSEDETGTGDGGRERARALMIGATGRTGRDAGGRIDVARARTQPVVAARRSTWPPGEDGRLTIPDPE